MDSHAKDYIGKMYNSRPGQKKSLQDSSQKNPNRVAGGIRGSGTNTVVVVDESGRELQLPTHRYIQALEQQIVQQRASMRSLTSKLNQLDNNYSTVFAELNRMRRG